MAILQGQETGDVWKIGRTVMCKCANAKYFHIVTLFNFQIIKWQF